MEADSDPEIVGSLFEATVGPLQPSRIRRSAIASFRGNAPMRRTAMLGILFEAACPTSCGGRDVLRPLWAEEAMHRATNMLQFVLLLERESWTGSSNPVDIEIECAMARSLAAAFRSLDMSKEDALLPCAEPLRAVVSGLVALFGPINGDITLRMDLVRLALPAYKRRALVLAANELVTNALKHAFRGCRAGAVSVTLDRVDCANGRLLVEDSGAGIDLTRPGVGCTIVAGLAGLLEADLLYRRSALGGTAAEFQFPI